jgi:hypothetical protein
MKEELEEKFSNKKRTRSSTNIINEEKEKEKLKKLKAEETEEPEEITPNKLITKIFPHRNTRKKKFTKVNRFIITMKKKFGVVGVSIIAPLFLSIPLGVFICLKFFGDRPKIIFWMSFFVVFWTIVLYFGLLHFRTLFETLIV